MLKNQKFEISCPLLFSISMACALMSGQANAQSTTTGGEQLTMGSSSNLGTSTDTWDDGSVSDTWSDVTRSGGWPGTSFPGPSYQHVSCPRRDGGFPGAFPHPSSSFPFPGGTGAEHEFPGLDALVDLGYHCSVQGSYGHNSFDCSCGPMQESRTGILDSNWFWERPTHQSQVAGCEEIFKQQCGDLRVETQTQCSNVFGECEALVVRRDMSSYIGGSLSMICECSDLSSWAVQHEYGSLLNVSGEMLRDRCASELAHCGVEPVGEGAAKSLDLGGEMSSMAACGSAFGSCGLFRRASGMQELVCECEDGKSTKVAGNLGWGPVGAGELLQRCAQEIARCAPGQNGGLDLGVEEAPGTTGAAVFEPGSGTGGGVAPVDQAPVQVNCSLGHGAGRGGLSLLGLIGLLGWCRRR